MKNIVILGSTGSIGKSTIEVIEANKDDFFIAGLVAKSNEKLLTEQAEKFNVKNVCLTDQTSKNEKFTN